MTPTYLIRQDRGIQTYMVSKWEMGKQPIEVYTVFLGKRPKCSCVSGHSRGYCKHTGMVKEWIKRGMPMEEIT